MTRLDRVAALIVYGSDLEDRLRLIEALAGDLAADEACAVVLTSSPLGAAVRPLRLPAAATLHAGGGGCPCCIGRVALQVTLARLLRQSQARRLLIELSGAGHLAGAVAALREDRLGAVVRTAGILQAQRP